MFEAGDVVRFFSPTAGKEKFHLCLGRIENGIVFCFLYLNSGKGYRGDCVLEDGQIPGLPKSPTGETIVSFSAIVRMREDRLAIFGAAKTGKISAATAGDLAAFAKTVRSLNESDKRFVHSALEALF